MAGLAAFSVVVAWQAVAGTTAALVDSFDQPKPRALGRVLIANVVFVVVTLMLLFAGSAISTYGSQTAQVPMLFGTVAAITICQFFVKHSLYRELEVPVRSPVRLAIFSVIPTFLPLVLLAVYVTMLIKADFR